MKTKRIVGRSAFIGTIAFLLYSTVQWLHPSDTATIVQIIIRYGCLAGLELVILVNSFIIGMSLYDEQII